MKYAIGILVFFLWLPVTSAFSPVVTEIDQPYEIVTLEGKAVEVEQYLGELQNYPVMYELTTETAMTLDVQVYQPYGGDALKPFSIIAIRKNDRGGGVAEVGRLAFDQTAWTQYKNPVLGISLWKSELFSRDVTPGTYRIEISTPKNTGKYLISFGSGDDSAGYVASVSGVRTLHSFFGYSVFRMLASSLVYYPLGILLLLFALQRTWKYRKLILKYPVWGEW